VYVVPAVTRTHPTAQRDKTGTRDGGVPQDGQAGLSGSTAEPEPSGSASPAPSTSPGAVTGPTALAGWANSLARLGIPAVALEAYGYAELQTAQSDPACHLSWTTLAGIGKIESDHGQEAGAKLLSNGTSSPAIFGPPLDGTNGNKLIRNTGSNPWDPASTYVRALGPMQFLPGTWQTYGTDGDRDGRADPFDVYDAAMSAARYLCANNHNLGTGQGWWDAIHTYNNLDRYAANAYAAANDYGLRSHA
jgi:membrane-bound lytic murein transglycosylase B